LVTDGSFKSNRKYLTANIKQWVIDMPTEELGPVVTGFPIPQVYQKNQYEHDDDSSSGQASYMSSCAQSYGSVDGSVDEQFFDPPSQQRLYAAALTGASPTLPTVTEVIIPQRGTQSNPSDKSAIDYNKVIAGLQANITIANLQAQVKSLQTQLLGVQAPSTVTASSAPEPEVNKDRMATLESNMALMATQFDAWMLEMRQARQQDSPEQERNTHRTIISSNYRLANDQPTLVPLPIVQKTPIMIPWIPPITPEYNSSKKRHLANQLLQHRRYCQARPLNPYSQRLLLVLTPIANALNHQSRPNSQTWQPSWQHWLHHSTLKGMTPMIRNMYMTRMMREPFFV
jgi:hypothetical protein